MSLRDLFDRREPIPRGPQFVPVCRAPKDAPLVGGLPPQAPPPLMVNMGDVSVSRRVREARGA